MKNKFSLLRIFAVMIAVLTLVTAVLTSCSDAVDDSNNTTSDVTTDSAGATTTPAGEVTVTTEYVPQLEIPDERYDDYTFKIQSYIRAQNPFDCFFAEGQNGETLNDAVYKRNLELEKRLGVVIESETVTSGYKQMASNLKIAAESEMYTYDMICTAVSSMTTTALEGGLYDIATLKDVDLSKPWWDEKLNSAFSLGFHQYYVSGDAVTINNDATYIVRFNQDLAAENNLERDYFYDIVINGNWTISKMLEIAEGFELIEGDIRNYEDHYGIVAVDTFAQALWYGSNLQIISKNEDDLPFLIPHSDSMEDSYAKISSVFTNKATYSTQPSANRMAGKNHAATADAMLLSGNALFQSTVLESMIRTNDNSTKVGILPIPKSNASQEDYYCIVNPTGFCSAIALPYTISNPERTAAVLEAMMYYSSEYIRPAYFDTVFQFKVLDDEESFGILNIILESRVAPDLATLYEWGGLMKSIQIAAANGKDSIMSDYEAQEGVIKSEINGVIAKLQAKN